MHRKTHDFSRELMKEIREFQDDCKLPKFRRMDFSNKMYKTVNLGDRLVKLNGLRQ